MAELLRQLMQQAQAELTRQMRDSNGAKVTVTATFRLTLKRRLRLIRLALSPTQRGTIRFNRPALQFTNVSGIDNRKSVTSQ